MKRLYPILSALLLLAACAESDTDRAVTQQLQNSPDFHATFEADDTRTFVDEKVRLLWTEGDLISIFTNTLNQKYEFDGETGDNSGTFTPISSGQFGSGSSLSVDANYAVYPYNQSTKISYDGELSIELPATQAYAEDSFGVNANTMVAVTQSQNDNFLSFKNLGGFLKLQLYGDVTVKSIHLEGNNGEKIAGGATVTAKYVKNPTLSMDSDATTSITLDCGAGVKLGTSSSSATEFWIVVPPVTFTKGFTITITDTEGGTMTKSTSKSYTVERNVMKSMTAFEVETELLIPTNEIWYTSTDGKVVELNSSYIYNGCSFGADVVSNEYKNGKGVITFDGEITEIAGYAFWHTNSEQKSTLQSVIIPKSVTTIGYYAFCHSSLESINIHNGVVHIEGGAFGNCNLANVNIPDSVTKIGNGAFSDNLSLTSVTLPPIADISYNVFAGCENLTEINGEYASADKRCWIVDGKLKLFLPAGLTKYSIPSNVTTIGESAFAYCEKLTDIIIPNGVKIIEVGAFSNCKGLTEVNLPNSVSEIGNGAFSGCTGIESFTIPDGITIEQNFLSGCTNLRSIYGKNASSDNRCWIVDGELLIFAPAGLTQYTIPDGITKIGYAAFARCSSLTSVSIPNSVTSIGRGAFQGCSSLANITIPNSVTKIGNDVFHGCISLTEVVIPDSVTDFEYGVFVNCPSLKKVTLSKNITKIGDYTFNGCESLTDVVIPDGVTEIGQYAFSHCRSLPSINIPEGVTKIGKDAFMQCYALTNVSLPSTLKSIDEAGFGNCQAMTAVYCKAVTPPTLADYAFGGGNLEAVFVPVESVDAYKAIKWGGDYYNTPSYVGWNFSEDDGNGDMKTLEIHYTTTDGNIITPYGNNPFEGTQIISNTYKDGKGVITLDGYVARIGQLAFYNCVTLKSITIPAGVLSIGYGAFIGCKNLSSVAIPQGVSMIGASTFSGCSSLTDVNIPNGVTLIESYTFDGCSSLSSIDIPLGVTKIENCAFRDCSNLKNITIPSSVTEIGYEAFFNCSILSNITIPQGVTKIESKTFSYCDGLTTITIPQGVTTIAQEAFFECSNLANVSIPDSVTEIGDAAFMLCTSLTGIDLSNVKNIGESAFRRCDLIDNITISNGVTEIKSSTFFDCGNIKNISLPQSVTIIGAYAFYGCKNLSNINIPESVTQIDNNAFSGCSSLSSINIPNGIVQIASDTFWDCSSLTTITIPASVSIIECDAFKYCENLHTVDCKAIEPPILSEGSYGARNAFAYCESLSTINVPTASVDAYKAAENWSNYATKITGKDFE